eukprot:1155207-Pelagomonas_calceolata.AAC.1
MIYACLHPRSCLLGTTHSIHHQQSKNNAGPGLESRLANCPETTHKRGVPSGLHSNHDSPFALVWLMRRSRTTCGRPRLFKLEHKPGPTPFPPPKTDADDNGSCVDTYIIR